MTGTCQWCGESDFSPCLVCGDCERCCKIKAHKPELMLENPKDSAAAWGRWMRGEAAQPKAAEG